MLKRLALEGRGLLLEEVVLAVAPSGLLLMTLARMMAKSTASRAVAGAISAILP
jgi:hypothetical protein